MLKQEVVVENKLGFHARPASLFAQTASKFKSEIFIEKNGNKVNGKSILGLMTLGIPQGAKINLLVEGEDEEQALKELLKLFAEKFGEE